MATSTTPLDRIARDVLTIGHRGIDLSAREDSEALLDLEGWRHVRGKDRDYSVTLKKCRDRDYLAVKLHCNTDDVVGEGWGPSWALAIRNAFDEFEAAPIPKEMEPVGLSEFKELAFNIASAALDQLSRGEPEALDDHHHDAVEEAACKCLVEFWEDYDLWQRERGDS